MKHQKFSEIDAFIVKWEVEEALQGRKLKHIRYYHKRGFIFYFDRKMRLLISVNPTLYRLHLTEREAREEHFLAFEEYLRGYTLTDIRIKKWDRLFYLLFTKDRGLSTIVLAVELTGKHSNLILVNEDGKILEAFRKIRNSKIRDVVPGIAYTPPPPKPFDLKNDVEKLAKYIPWLTPPYGEKIFEAIHSPTPLYCAELDIYAPISIPCKNLRRFETYSALLDFYFGKFEATKDYPEEKSSRLLDELERVKDFEEYRIAGENLLNGKYVVDSERIFVKGREKEFVLEMPTSGKISDLANELFKKYRRYRRGYETLLKKLEAQEEVKILESEAQTHISKIEENIEPYEKFISPSGYTVLRGKNARGNEIITFKLTSPDDYFLHVENAPGAHVIIKSGREEPDEVDLEFGAQKAFEKSKAAADKKGTVIVTKKKYLKRGFAPGQVLIFKVLKTIEVRLE